MSQIDIQIDRPQYYAGDIINGKLVCHFHSKKQFRKICVRLECKEYTKWMGTEDYYDHYEKKYKTRNVQYTGDKTVLHREEILCGEGTRNTGEHIFPFRFPLPQDVPSSFQCSYGYVGYSITAVVDRPRKFDLEDVKQFTVISPIKLDNLDPEARKPGEWSDEKIVCCFCCASGPIKMNVYLDKTGFVIGETFNLKIYCSNLSNINVEAVSVKLIMKMTYETVTPHHERKSDKELISSSYNSGVGAHGDKTYNLSLEIPPSTNVPNFTGCDLFSFYTDLEINASLAGCHTDLDVGLTVSLGHIPFTFPSAAVSSCGYEQAALPYPINPPPLGFQMPMSVPKNSTISMPPFPINPPPLGFQVPMSVPENSTISMPMPMLIPGNSASTAPPSAPQDEAAASAPPKSMLTSNEQPSAGEASTFEMPPPSYEEAARNFKFPPK